MGDIMLKSKKIIDGVFWVGAVDFSRRLFDALVPLPDGTSYNSYFVRGTEKTALIDTVDPTTASTLMTHLDGVERIDYVVANHAEQDHSGAIPTVLARGKAPRVCLYTVDPLDRDSDDILKGGPRALQLRSFRLPPGERRALLEQGGACLRGH
jgi:glyoxylase-like metal-dependent hydrolase (beta-lactamase superfamily II)